MPGTFILSLDTELAWGTLDKEGFRTYRRHLEQVRPNVVSLLSILEKHDVAATWAFVGHLMLDSCSREGSGADPHPDALTARFPWYDRHWHDHDPASTRDQAPFWYGDDLLDMVLDASPKHEIGSHTFSHLPLDGPEVKEEIARSQIVKCLELANRRGLSLRSFVFPRNRVAHRPVLSEQGFTCYRGPEESWYTRLPRPLARAGHFAHRLLGMAPPVYRELDVEFGLVNLPASMFLMPPDGVRALIPGRSRVRQAVLGLRRSARTDGVFHLWFHPWNIGTSGAMLRWLDAILDEVDTLRARGDLRVRTMGALAGEVLAERA
jgi:peptidoglycan/xylan/chitin deacetylase (PgdA/CDA1 family)